MSTTLLYPTSQLSLQGNREEFNIPETPLGDAVCRCRLAWGRVQGVLQPCIILEGVYYPGGMTPATAKEVYDEA